MKKMILTLALALCASLAAQAQVYSNTVGMIKTTVPAGSFELVSLPFEGTNGEITLGEAFGEVADQTVVYVWSNSEYTDYTYHTAGDGWYNSGFDPADDVVILKGSSIWVKAGASETTLIHSGSVPEIESKSVDFNVGFNLISIPYPVEFELGDLDVSNVSDQDVIYIWNGNGYTDYTYHTAGNGWYDSGFQSAATVSIPAGKGVWLKANSSGSIVINKTY